MEPSSFPQVCPFTFSQVMADNFWPDEEHVGMAHGKICPVRGAWSRVASRVRRGGRYITPAQAQVQAQANALAGSGAWAGPRACTGLIALQSRGQSFGTKSR